MRQLFAQEDLMQVLGLTEQGQRWLEGKLARYRSNLTVEDWMDVIAKQKLGTLEQDEWQFTDARVVTARLHFKSDRPLTEQERRTAERAAQEALETYWLKQQAERKEPK